MRLHQVFARETMFLGEKMSLKSSSFEDGNEKRDTLKWFFNNYYKTRRLQFDAGLPQHTTRRYTQNKQHSWATRNTLESLGVLKAAKHYLSRN
mmetsp:Transcript_27394/g.33885  ORF Transcript_27394/g.33885 Transcript_27394/m.33885 type:complete len:93 (-) Transcript_27394:6-284(-)